MRPTEVHVPLQREAGGSALYPTPTRRRRWRGRHWLGLVVVCAVVAGTTAMTPISSIAPWLAMANANWSAPTPKPAVEAASRPAAPRALDDSPEARLMAAYQASADGQGELAFRMSQDLLRDYPGFSLGQLLHADLLASRSGRPSFQGAPLQSVEPANEDLDTLREESRRRFDALLRPPAPGTLPREFAALPASTRRAIAVDASRSRLYLFVNGPKGLTLERDFYVSLGKAGVDKKIADDLRTPLGVYWITSSLAANQIDPRLGSAALGISYPNAWDRSQGRKGNGLFVHGVPEDTLARPPFSTDGCLALANSDVLYLADRLATVDTPLVISRQLSWVSADTPSQDAATFRQAYDAWDGARRRGDDRQTSLWYDSTATREEPAMRSQAPRQGLSLIGWYGESAPMMIVTGQQDGESEAAKSFGVRQYWIQRAGQWRILFEGKVPPPITAMLRGATPRSITDGKSNRSTLAADNSKVRGGG